MHIYSFQLLYWDTDIIEYICAENIQYPFYALFFVHIKLIHIYTHTNTCTFEQILNLNSDSAYGLKM